MSTESEVVKQVFSKLSPDEKTTVVISTRGGSVVKTNRSQETGQKYATWASILCKNTVTQLKEDVRLLQIATEESKITISTISSSQFLLITIDNQSETQSPSDS